MSLRLGLDIGDVLVSGNHKQIMDQDAYNTRPSMDGAFATVAALVATKRFAAENIFLVSYCGAETERKTRLWLHAQQFPEITGVLESNWFFVRNRDDKAPICRALTLTHFVDDKLSILRTIRGENPDMTLYGLNPIRDIPIAKPNGIIIANTWNTLHQLLMQ